MGRKINLFFQQTETFFQKVILPPIQFKRILSNLIENAREAMPDGGNILVRFSIVGQEIHIKIRDNGEGMDPKVLKMVQKVGGSYNKKHGSGHGLSHAKSTLAKWGGDLQIESLQGIGSIVTVKIPRRSRPRLNVV